MILQRAMRKDPLFRTHLSSVVPVALSSAIHGWTDEAFISSAGVNWSGPVDSSPQASVLLIKN